MHHFSVLQRSRNSLTVEFCEREFLPYHKKRVGVAGLTGLEGGRWKLQEINLLYSSPVSFCGTPLLKRLAAIPNGHFILARLISSVSDGAANMIKCFAEWLKSDHLICYAHTLHNFLLKMNTFPQLNIFLAKCGKL